MHQHYSPLLTANGRSKGRALASERQTAFRSSKTATGLKPYMSPPLDRLEKAEQVDIEEYRQALTRRDALYTSFAAVAEMADAYVTLCTVGRLRRARMLATRLSRISHRICCLPRCPCRCSPCLDCRSPSSFLGKGIRISHWCSTPIGCRRHTFLRSHPSQPTSNDSLGPIDRNVSSRELARKLCFPYQSTIDPRVNR